MRQKIDNAMDREHLHSVLNRNALAQEGMSPERLFAVKEDMEKAEARRLQPYFVRSFFMKAFAQLVGAAEKCPSRCIHPGKPQNAAEPGLEALIARVDRQPPALVWQVVD